MKNKLIRILLSLIILIILSSCSNKVIKDDRYLLGTICSIQIYNSSDDSLLEGAFQILSDVEKTFSFTDENSELSFVNKNAYKEEVEVSDSFFNLLSLAIEYSLLSDGYFNPLLGSLIERYDVSGLNPKLLSESEINELLPYTSLDYIKLDKDKRSVRLLSDKTKIHLGGIAKGYASELVRDYLTEHDIKSAIINLGGSVYVVGTKPNGESWVVALQNPDLDRGGYYATVDAIDSAVVTSGSYERFNIVDGSFIHHIIDPRSGRPSSSDLLSATVISSDGSLADVFSTALFVAGEEESRRIVEKNKLTAVLLNKDNLIIRL